MSKKRGSDAVKKKVGRGRIAYQMPSDGAKRTKNDEKRGKRGRGYGTDKGRKNRCGQKRQNVEENRGRELGAEQNHRGKRNQNVRFSGKARVAREKRERNSEFLLEAIEV